MRVLILGGTGFVGRHLAEACLAAGHELTLFHRGRSNPGLFPGAEHLLGDRDTDLSALRGRRFDLVIDPSGYEVAPVRAAARALAHPDLRYLFVSSISVYSDYSRSDEASAPVHELEGAETASLSFETYGGLKVACERALEAELPGRVLAVRAGLILGPHDYDGRFRYWLTRVAAGGEVLAPGDPEALTQAVDVRDLAAWALSAAGRGVSGAHNVTSPAMTMRALLAEIQGVVGGDARFTWVPDDILLEQQVRPYSEMPFWLPAAAGARPVSIERAVRQGLTFRPFADTIRDTWAWLRTGWDAELAVRENRRLHIAAGMTAEREAQVLLAARERLPDLARARPLSG